MLRLLQFETRSTRFFKICVSHLKKLGNVKVARRELYIAYLRTLGAIAQNLVALVNWLRSVGIPACSYQHTNIFSIKHRNPLDRALHGSQNQFGCCAIRN
jgi:hypothetical protein